MRGELEILAAARKREVEKGVGRTKVERREVRRRKRAILLQLETRKEGRLSCCEKARAAA